MTVKLTDAQLVMLSAASQRQDLCRTMPEKMKGAVLDKVGEKLLKSFLRLSPRGSGNGSWRRASPGMAGPLAASPQIAKAMTGTNWNGSSLLRPSAGQERGGE